MLQLLPMFNLLFSQDKGSPATAVQSDVMQEAHAVCRLVCIDMYFQVVYACLPTIYLVITFLLLFRPASQLCVWYDQCPTQPTGATST